MNLGSEIPSPQSVYYDIMKLSRVKNETPNTHSHPFGILETSLFTDLDDFLTGLIVDRIPVQSGLSAWVKTDSIVPVKKLSKVKARKGLPMQGKRAGLAQGRRNRTEALAVS